MGGPYKICILYVLRRRDGERQNGWGGGDRNAELNFCGLSVFVLDL